MTGWLPNRSVRRPETGDSAYIPKTWALITMPIAARPWPWWAMWSGVIVMIRTMTTCPAMSAMIADRDVRAAQQPLERRGPGRASSRRPCRTCRRAAYGSGRRQDERQERRAARRTRSARGRRPTSAGSPTATATVAGRRDQVRADDRPDGRAPDDEADAPRRGGRGRTGRRPRSATAGWRCCRTRSGPSRAGTAGTSRR